MTPIFRIRTSEDWDSAKMGGAIPYKARKAIVIGRDVRSNCCSIFSEKCIICKTIMVFRQARLEKHLININNNNYNRAIIFLLFIRTRKDHDLLFSKSDLIFFFLLFIFYRNFEIIYKPILNIRCISVSKQEKSCLTTPENIN